MRPRHEAVENALAWHVNQDLGRASMRPRHEAVENSATFMTTAPADWLQ